MSSQYIGQILPVSFNFAPQGWALCNGQLLAIDQNQALFSLLGTTYGGDGRVNFGLPNLQGRVPMHMGSGFTLGQSGGEVAHTLSAGEIGAHAHTVTPAASKDEETTNRPDGAYFTSAGAYGSVANASMGGTVTSVTGGGQPHENRQPSLVLSFVIALVGIFPSQN